MNANALANANESGGLTTLHPSETILLQVLLSAIGRISFSGCVFAPTPTRLRLRLDELMQQNNELQNRGEDVEIVAQQLKQLEELVSELEEGLEDARRGEAEARTRRMAE